MWIEHICLSYLAFLEITRAFKTDGSILMWKIRKQRHQCPLRNCWKTLGIAWNLQNDSSELLKRQEILFKRQKKKKKGKKGPATIYMMTYWRIQFEVDGTMGLLSPFLNPVSLSVRSNGELHFYTFIQKQWHNSWHWKEEWEILREDLVSCRHRDPTVLQSCPDSQLTLWTIAHGAHLSAKFSRQQYWKDTISFSDSIPSIKTEGRL